MFKHQFHYSEVDFFCDSNRYTLTTAIAESDEYRGNVVSKENIDHPPLSSRNPQYEYETPKIHLHTAVEEYQLARLYARLFIHI